MDVYTGKENSAVVDYLLKRRSAKIDDLAEPGPSEDEIAQIITAATRVPDHGKMCPWYVMVFAGDARTKAGDIIADAYEAKHPDARAEKIEAERARFLRAPVVIALVSRVRKGKKPIWEQILSAGAAGMNLSLAAHALGYGVQWVTEWYAYDDRVKAELGLCERDHIAGFFYIGSVAKMPDERDRPDLGDIMHYWTPDAAPTKGDCYDQEKFGFPEVGFDLSKLK